MSQREILAIAIKVYALWFLGTLFINSVGFYPTLIALTSWQGTEIKSWVFIAVISSYLLAGLIIASLLFFVSTKTLKSLTIKSDISISEENKKYIFQVSGLFFVVSSLTYLPNSLTFLFYKDVETHVFIQLLRPLGYLLQLCIGTWLIVDSSWWALAFKKLRGRA